jgi:hypothetical protein
MKSNLVYSAHNQAYWPVRSYRSPSQPTVSVRLSELWQGLLSHLSPSTAAPRTWATLTADGQTLWNAYDPVSGRTIRHASDNEVRTWLEERYYLQRSATRRSK